MNKFTPGPWEVILKPMYFRIDFNDSCVHILYGNPNAREEAKANAHLISAAPDQNAALSELLERYTSLVNCGDCGNWDPETEAEVINARAALAKAQGNT